jgi:hypothetical protein
VTDRPMIELPVQAVVCPIHGEPFRAAWPAGYATAVMTLVRHALESSQELHEATGGDAHRLNAVIAEYGPLCRLVSAEQRLEAYTASARASAEFGQHGVCAGCRKWTLGGPYMGSIRGAGGVLTRHVCFECVANAGCGS